jgi:hypothetical protein
MNSETSWWQEKENYFVVAAVLVLIFPPLILPILIDYFSRKDDFK